MRYGAPAWTLFAAYTATATTPNTGGMARARWAHLLKGDADALHTANSFEQATDELCFMLGPVLARRSCAPRCSRRRARSVGVVLLVTGMLLLTARRSTEPRPARVRRRRLLPGAGHPVAARGVPGDGRGVRRHGGVVTIAFADAQGQPRGGRGGLLALQAAGSCAAGLLYGAIKLAGPAEYRLPWCVAADDRPADAAPARGLLSGSPPLLALTLLKGRRDGDGLDDGHHDDAGAAAAPRRAARNEGMTLAVTGLASSAASPAAARRAAGRWSTSPPPRPTASRSQRGGHGPKVYIQRTMLTMSSP